jgi:hypothetical protein
VERRHESAKSRATDDANFWRWEALGKPLYDIACGFLGFAVCIRRHPSLSSLMLVKVTLKRSEDMYISRDRRFQNSNFRQWYRLTFKVQRGQDSGSGHFLKYGKCQEMSCYAFETTVGQNGEKGWPEQKLATKHVRTQAQNHNVFDFGVGVVIIT